MPATTVILLIISGIRDYIRSGPIDRWLMVTVELLKE